MQVEKIYYRHYRYWQDWDGTPDYKSPPSRYYRSGKLKSGWTPTTRGGKTEAVAIVTYGGNTYEITATAVCRNDENFCYKTGREYAIDRLNLLLGHIKAMENLLAEKVDADNN